LGHTAGWVSCLGDDELGYYILNFIRAEGVDVSQVKRDPDAPTGIFIRERLTGGNARHFYYRSGSAFSRLSPEDLPEEYIASAKVLHLTGITPSLSESCLKALRVAIEIARKNQCLITFDPNVRLKLWTKDQALPILEEFMAAADYVLPGIEEMNQLYGDLPVERILALLHDLGCGNIIMKLGKEGAIISSPHGSKHLPGNPVNEPVDLMGAGDAFSAGFIAGLLKNMDMKDSAELANAVAGMSVMLPGNIESLPSWEEVSIYKKGLAVVAR
jgi:2-dehydro-3-deoxygluconokinase